MTSSTLRSTKTLTTFVQLTDESVLLAKRLKAIQAELKAMQPEVLEQIGDRRSVSVNKQVRIIERKKIESVKRVVDDETAVKYCKSKGLAFSERSEEYVAPATFLKYYREGLLSPELFAIETETTVVVN